MLRLSPGRNEDTTNVRHKWKMVTMQPKINGNGFYSIEILIGSENSMVISVHLGLPVTLLTTRWVIFVCIFLLITDLMRTLQYNINSGAT